MSAGEMAAAYAAGRVSIEEALIAAYYRGKSVAQVTRNGAMIAIGQNVSSAHRALKAPS